jgi:Tol biopolymer transport system component
MPDLGRQLDREIRTIRPATFTLADVARRRERRRRNQRIGAGVVALAIAVLTIGALLQAFGHVSSRLPAGPARNGRIAFISPGLGGPDDRLYTVLPDGRDLRQLSEVHAEYPSWSPDGSMVAFDDGSIVAYRDWSNAQGHIHIVNADGSGLRQVTAGQGAEFTPTWSPDGSHLAYTGTGRVGLPPGIFVLDLATGDMRAVTSNPYAGYLDKEPDYSPDGSRIVFVRDRQLLEAGGSTDREALFVVNVDGTGLRRLTPWATAVGTPSWSPDGATIVFRRGIVGVAPLPLPRIYTIGADGTDMRPLTDGTNSGSFWPSWSPSGNRIVFTRYADSNGLFQLYTMDRSGGNIAPLTPAAGSGQNEAAWGAQVS